MVSSYVCTTFHCNSYSKEFSLRSSSNLHDIYMAVPLGKVINKMDDTKIKKLSFEKTIPQKYNH